MVAERKSDLIKELSALLPNTPHARAVLERVRQELQPDHLFTTREAADFLGIRSVNTLKALLRAEQVPTVRIGTHTRIARQELERLRESRRLATVRTSDRQWDQGSVRRCREHERFSAGGRSGPAHLGRNRVHHGAEVS
jgi:excisionase family DNA binding protein